MSALISWSFSPLSGWVSRDSRYRQELAGSAPLGGMGPGLPWPAFPCGSGAPRWLRLVRVLARRRRRQRRKE